MHFVEAMPMAVIGMMLTKDIDGVADAKGEVRQIKKRGRTKTGAPSL